MVRGIESFRDWFRGYEKSYCVIGGTACSLLLTDRGLDFRTTRGMDIVLIAEETDVSFKERFRDYVSLAFYEKQNESKDNFFLYRLENPIAGEYPAVIHLFAKKADSSGLPETDYYNFLREGRTAVSGVSVLDAPYLIPFKARAWMDLTDKNEAGDPVRGREIQKQKNDLFRLTALLREGDTVPLHVPPAVSSDMTGFIKRMESEDVNLRHLGIRDCTKEEILNELSVMYTGQAEGDGVD